MCGRQLCWEKVESKPIPLKSVPPKTAAAVTASSSTAVVKSTPNSLVPYTQSSDSETSDTEANERAGTDTNNNSRTSVDEDDKRAVTAAAAASPSILSPLAKKNSTLTSLLTSSPKNENAPYRVTTSSPRPHSKPLRLDSMDSSGTDEVETSSQSSVGSVAKPEKRRAIISFNLFSGKKRMEMVKYEEAAKGEDSEKPKSTKQMIGAGVASVYSFLTGGSGNSEKKESEDEKRVNGHEETCKETTNSRTHAEGLANGVGKPNGMVNGTSNGWHVTAIDDDSESITDESYSSKSLSQGDWKVTEKSSCKSTSS